MILWVGALRVITAVEIPDIDPDEIAVSILEERLMFRGTGRIDFSLDVLLPCAVEGNRSFSRGARAPSASFL